mmetsp:Transcript_29716/g.95074  ORF Transcript_29716/g.95074 Transcript_29716/m.95074 type:complete len:286 (+) Transcript_29716:1173-2030(+)
MRSIAHEEDPPVHGVLGGDHGIHRPWPPTAELPRDRPPVLGDSTRDVGTLLPTFPDIPRRLCADDRCDQLMAFLCSQDPILRWGEVRHLRHPLPLVDIVGNNARYDLGVEHEVEHRELALEPACQLGALEVDADEALDPALPLQPDVADLPHFASRAISCDQVLAGDIHRPPCCCGVRWGRMGAELDDQVVPVLADVRHLVLCKEPNALALPSKLPQVVLELRLSNVAREHVAAAPEVRVGAIPIVAVIDHPELSSYQGGRVSKVLPLIQRRHLLLQGLVQPHLV